jgi:hypothetical protein
MRRKGFFNQWIKNGGNMKRKLNLKNLRWVGGLLILLTVVTVGPAFAETITKSFEFGAGTANPISHKRNFYVPCQVNVTVSIEVYRLGGEVEQKSYSAAFELLAPGAGDGEHSDFRSRVIYPEPQIITLNGAKTNRGCSLPWAVRAKPQTGDPPSSVAIIGTISFSYNSNSRNIDVEGSLISLNKGNSVTKNVGSSSGFGHGDIVITANWNHAIGPVIGPNPVRLKFELINPSGTVVRTVSAYSSNEMRSDLEKFRLTYQVPDCEGLGQWKLRITNNSDDDTMNIDPKVQFKPDCP